MKRIAVLIAALIIYGSLYPWQFHDNFQNRNPLAILLTSFPLHWTHWIVKDNVVNVLLYLPLGLFAFLATRPNRSDPQRTAFAVGIGVLVSTCIELAQVYDANRTTSLLDVFCNGLGAYVGALLGAAFEPLWMSARRFPALLLLACWAGFQLLLPRANPLLPLTGGLLTFAEWVSVGALLEFVRGAKLAKIVLPVALLLLPCAPVVLHRPLSIAEIGGAVAGTILVLVWGGMRLVFRGVLGGAFLLALTGNELSPFRFSSTGSGITWLPFHALLASDMEYGFSILLRKVFDYGAAVWLLARSGLGFGIAAVIVCTVLGCIELMQTHIPPHVAETTDPLFAALLAALFASVPQAVPASPARARNPEAAPAAMR